ncbi:MAG: hypothetical protein GY811_22455 [Myxococcales bacterium]|nr:hypothetical protein [Myxococcales bacterium]
MIGAIEIDGIRNLITINSGTTTDVFEAYVTKQLVPTLRPSDIVVMDNLNVHKNATCGCHSRCRSGRPLPPTVFSRIQSH